MPDSNANKRRQLILAVLLILALFASGLSGAWIYARLYDGPGSTVGQKLTHMHQASHDEAYLRESLAVLADKVGALQARIIAIDVLGHRVAEAAGVRHTEPELDANLPFGTVTESDRNITGSARLMPMAFTEPRADTGPVMDFIETDDQLTTPDALVQHLDVLLQHVRAQEDGLALLDLMLTRRAGIAASLPSYSPVDYPYLSSSFGWRRNPVTGRHSMHEGLDFAAPAGTPIYAASGGVVTQARFRSGYGNLVEIMHGNGLSTRYAHASKIKVKEGELVEAGQVIALVGSTGRSTGAHLHFEVRVAGHPLDPTLFLPSQPAVPLIADASDHLTATGPQVR